MTGKRGVEKAACAQNTAWELSDITYEILPGKGSEGRRAESTHSGQAAAAIPRTRRGGVAGGRPPLGAACLLAVPTAASKELAGLCRPDGNYGNQACVLILAPKEPRSRRG